ncbi:hypothetical protein PanWU01x14_281120 [Parasponia andersonii]|uniref:Uncharacterized protein n=1 Tax=Parasponia andersonii TaxID=3476 RepID=A0A2P5B155_PARAD|nr:hypothetical protein PanWU01x14_281120 [Parasponia andersonii]
MKGQPREPVGRGRLVRLLEDIRICEEKEEESRASQKSEEGDGDEFHQNCVGIGLWKIRKKKERRSRLSEEAKSIYSLHKGMYSYYCLKITTCPSLRGKLNLPKKKKK